MELTERKILYRAMLSRDPRYDGRFYTGVKTTGIYCRPICPARPKFENVIFYRSKAEAENAGFRPCLRCRPDLSPLSPQWHGTASVMPRAIRLLEQGDAEGVDVRLIAEKLGMTDRHLRRLFQEHIGASPIEVAISRRLHLARQLLSQTNLTITEVAFASGFNSARRFNDAFVKTYKTAPRNFRKVTTYSDSTSSLKIELPVVLPFDWEYLMGQLTRHATPGVEVVENNCYSRFFKTAKGVNFFRAWPKADGSALLAEIQLMDLGDLRWTIERIRSLFDLSHNPHSVKFKKNKCFKADGVRIHGVFDSFEGAVGVVLGQLVTTEQGQRNMQKLVERFGEKIGDEKTGLTHLFPTPASIANSTTEDWKGIGFTKSWQEAIISLAREVAANTLDLSPSCDLRMTREKLLSIKGIGPWTVEMIALRCLKDPDAFPLKDLIILRAVEKFKLNPTDFSPWRAYATLAIWRSQAHLLTKKKVK